MMSENVKKINVIVICAPDLKFDEQFYSKKFYMVIFTLYVTITWSFLHFSPCLYGVLKMSEAFFPSGLGFYKKAHEGDDNLYFCN